MQLPESRYRFTQKRSPRHGRLWVIIFTAVIVAGIAIFLFLNNDKDDSLPINSVVEEKEHQDSLETMWEVRNFEALNEKCEEILLASPFDFEALMFNGFSYFYRGVGQFSLEERLSLIDLSIINLRKALILDPTPLQGKLEYILGKAYYQKGKFYLDLSSKYLEESINSGYIGEDTYEYLGLVYSSLGDYSRSAEYYLEALERSPSDTLYLVLAQTYYQMDDILQAEEYLVWALSKTQDQTVEEKSRFLLGRIYRERGELEKAEEQFLSILVDNKSSADAYFFLGEVYEDTGDVAKARYQWRMVLEINPYHYCARLKLY